MKTPIRTTGRYAVAAAVVWAPLAIPAACAQPPSALPRFQPADVFGLRYASDVALSPDARHVAYVVVKLDIATDRRVPSLHVMAADGSKDEEVPGAGAATDPRWSPDGRTLAFVAPVDGVTQLFVWQRGAAVRRLTRSTTSVATPRWSPDGSVIAFTSAVPKPKPSLFTMPDKPDGAHWAPEPKVAVEDFKAYDVGEIEPTTREIFLQPLSGGSSRQLTHGENDYADLAWSADGRSLLVAGRRDPADEAYVPARTAYRLSIADGSAAPIATGIANVRSPIEAVDGTLAFLGTDRRDAGSYFKLYVANRSGGTRPLSAALDRDIRSISWSGDGKTLLALYTDQSQFKIARFDFSGRMTVVADHVGPSDMGRPQAKGASFSAAGNAVAFSTSNSLRPGDVAIADDRGSRRLTGLNDAFVAERTWGDTQEIRFASSFDGLPLEGWLTTPPDHTKGQTCPLILLIHGGPWGTFSGDYFSGEAQIYSAAGYCVLSVNYRGSGSYGQAFQDSTRQAFPGHDYDDLMSGVDAMIARGYARRDRLYVTGGSAGGALTGWIVGHTKRFRAAVAQKGMFDLTSFVLTVDNPRIYDLFADKLPWDDPDHYRARSPLTFIKQIETPTMVVVGGNDVRTPVGSQSEAFYNALRLRRVPTMLVRLPGAGHEYSNRPSQLIAGALATLGWFERYDKAP